MEGWAAAAEEKGVEGWAKEGGADGWGGQVGWGGSEEAGGGSHRPHLGADKHNIYIVLLFYTSGSNPNYDVPYIFDIIFYCFGGDVT